MASHVRYRPNPVFGALGTTIFSVMSALAVKHNAINLGQGFPDQDGPLTIREQAAKALIDGPNQYPPTRGVRPLRSAIASHTRKFYGIDCDAERNVVVTSGATEALACCIMALAGGGGEVVLIEPAYDSYRPIAEAAGAVVRSAKLRPPYWRLSRDMLENIVTPNTRAIVLNSPCNPVGRVFDRHELEIVADVVRASNAAVVCDEVYEHLVFDGRQHVPLQTLPGMSGRVVRVGSAGKMFSLTGWKVGWVTGDPALIDVIAKVHQFLTFTTSPSLQMGIAHALENEIGFTLRLTDTLQDNRDLLASGLRQIGFDVLPCEGTYFLTAGIRSLTNEPDRAFCERLVREAGVALIPLSVFFVDGSPDHLVRFAFCKSRNVIEEAIVRLGSYFSTSGKKND